MLLKWVTLFDFNPFLENGIKEAPTARPEKV